MSKYSINVSDLMMSISIYWLKLAFQGAAILDHLTRGHGARTKLFCPGGEDIAQSSYD